MKKSGRRSSNQEEASTGKSAWHPSRPPDSRPTRKRVPGFVNGLVHRAIQTDSWEPFFRAIAQRNDVIGSMTPDPIFIVISAALRSSSIDAAGARGCGDVFPTAKTGPAKMRPTNGVNRSAKRGSSSNRITIFTASFFDLRRGGGFLCHLPWRSPVCRSGRSSRSWFSCSC